MIDEFWAHRFMILWIIYLISDWLCDLNDIKDKSSPKSKEKSMWINDISNSIYVQTCA